MIAERAITGRKLLDLQAYAERDGFNFKGLTRDVAHVALEVDKTKPIEERIVPVLMAVIGQGQVINWPVSKTKDVREMYSIKNELDKKETEAGLTIREFLLTGRENEIVLQISPPGGPCDYPEGRLQIATIQYKMGFKILKQYGIPIKCSPEDCVNLFGWMQGFSREKAQIVSAPEDLRNKVLKLKIPNSKNWLVFMQESIPQMEIAWRAIESGQVSQNFRKTLRNSQAAVAKNEPVIRNARLPSQLIYAGAGIEMDMMTRGHNLFSDLCGILNSDLISGPQRYSALKVEVSGGQITTHVAEVWKCVECPNCKHIVDAEVADGKIHCPDCGAERPIPAKTTS